MGVLGRRDAAAEYWSATAPLRTRAKDAEALPGALRTSHRAQRIEPPRIDDVIRRPAVEVVLGHARFRKLLPAIVLAGGDGAFHVRIEIGAEHPYQGAEARPDRQPVGGAGVGRRSRPFQAGSWAGLVRPPPWSASGVLGEAGGLDAAAGDQPGALSRRARSARARLIDEPQWFRPALARR